MRQRLPIKAEMRRSMSADFLSAGRKGGSIATAQVAMVVPHVAEQMKQRRTGLNLSKDLFDEM
mgnify:CR=1 FL=1